MKERPILFQGAMVRALLDGRKTQTRRLVKPMPGHQSTWLTVEKLSRSPRAMIARTNPENWFGAQFAHPLAGQFAHGVQNEEWSPLCWVKCPYGEPGDRLWVREAWWHHKSSAIEQAGFVGGSVCNLDRKGCDFHPNQDFDPAKYPELWRKRPSIHMPRWASRITLEITDVRVQRLHEISETDSLAEGIRQMRDGSGTFVGREGPGKLVTPWLTAKEAYFDLWDDINGHGAWRENPWTWAISFRESA